MPEIVGNKAVEDSALKFVMDYGTAAGRHPNDTRRVPAAAAGLTGDDRLIEVNAAGGSSRGFELWLEPAQYRAAIVHPGFRLSLVENVGQGDPAHFRLLDIHGERLRRLPAQAEERHHYCVPGSVAEHDNAVWRESTAPERT